MTLDKADIPIKISVLAILFLTRSDNSPSVATIDEINDFLKINRDNLRYDLYRLHQQGMLSRVNPGVRPAQYQISDKGKEEFRTCGRRR